MFLYIYLECSNTNDGYLPANYTGNISRTIKGHKCKRWLKTAYASSFPDGCRHNYCRNPSAVAMPGAWCISQKTNKWEYCSCT